MVHLFISLTLRSPVFGSDWNVTAANFTWSIKWCCLAYFLSHLFSKETNIRKHRLNGIRRSLYKLIVFFVSRRIWKLTFLCIFCFLYQALDAKVLIFKKKRRKNYRRTKGHRQVCEKWGLLNVSTLLKTIAWSIFSFSGTD